MRIAVFSDVHGNLTALEAVLKDIRVHQAPDAVVCLGDLAYKGPQPRECLDLLREMKIPCVYGNTDRGLLRAAGRIQDGRSIDPAERPYLEWHLDQLRSDHLEYLAGLPFEYRLEVDGLRLLGVHANPQDCHAAIRPGQPLADVGERVAGTDADWVLMGHIHEPFLFRHGGVQLLNVGAVGFSLDGDWRACYVVLDLATGSVVFRRVEYDLDAAVRAARKRGFCFAPEWYGEALCKGWWEPVPWELRRGIDGFPR